MVFKTLKGACSLNEHLLYFNLVDKANIRLRKPCNTGLFSK